MAENPKSRTFSAISPGAIMPELLLAAKNFGSHSRHRLTASPKPIATQNPYIEVEKLSHEAALLGHEYEDENDDDDHGCGAAARDR